MKNSNVSQLKKPLSFILIMALLANVEGFGNSTQQSFKDVDKEKGVLPATTITYINKSGKILYIYYIVTDQTTQFCDDLIYKGEFNPGDQWSLSVPNGEFGWVRFQLEGEPCSLRNNKFEQKIWGVKEFKGVTYVN